MSQNQCAAVCERNHRFGPQQRHCERISEQYFLCTCTSRPTEVETSANASPLQSIFVKKKKTEEKPKGEKNIVRVLWTRRISFRFSSIHFALKCIETCLASRNFSMVLHQTAKRLLFHEEVAHVAASAAYISTREWFFVYMGFQCASPNPTQIQQQQTQKKNHVKKTINATMQKKNTPHQTSRLFQPQQKNELNDFHFHSFIPFQPILLPLFASLASGCLSQLPVVNWTQMMAVTMCDVRFIYSYIMYDILVYWMLNMLGWLSALREWRRTHGDIRITKEVLHVWLHLPYALQALENVWKPSITLRIFSNRSLF